MQNNYRNTILILGGTREAVELADRLAKEPNTRVITSLAGRTRNPLRPAGEVRIGGFGGVTGLVAYLKNEKIDLLIDATHPFAKQISANATAAAKLAGISIKIQQRPAWTMTEGDLWHSVSNEEEAALVLPENSRVFLALGSQYLAPFYPCKNVHFVVRMVDYPENRLPFASHELIVAKPPRNSADEMKIMKSHQITHLVCRNSGGNRGHAKIVAARALAIPVVMIERPAVISVA